jgi:indole-3-acetate monooxygenase
MASPLESARELAPQIAAAAAETERERRLPRELVEALRARGLFHLLVPQSLGGLECDPVTAAEVVEEVARADASTGWCLMIAAQNAAFAGFMPQDQARIVWGDGQIACGTARPIGSAEVTSAPEPGYIVSGRWPFASGSSHADWFAGECIVYENGEAKRDADGNELTRMCMIPAAEVALHDTWHTTGLRGTASNDFSVDSVFVPRDRGFSFANQEAFHPWALYSAGPLVFINHGSHALGIARAALESVAEIAANKPAWGNKTVLRQERPVQLQYAEALALVESARSYFYETSRSYWDRCVAGDPGDAIDRARVRLAASHAAASAVRAVDILHGAMGTSGIFTKSPLERQFRDAHTAGAHVMISPLSLEAAGRVALGLDADFPFF